MIIRKIKALIKRSITKTKVIIKEKIPIFFQRHFFSKKLREIFQNIGIIEIQEYKPEIWHLGYRYYVGFYNDKKVFVKFNTKVNWILNEIENIKYIQESSKYLSEKIPKMYQYKVTPKYGFIVEEFFEYESIEKCIDKKENMDKNKIYFQFIEIIKEMQRIKIIHLDINENNLYVSKESDIFIIDFGFSMIDKKDKINFIGNKHLKDLILLNLNTETRLEPGCIDDAISFIEVAKKIDPSFISNNYKEWLIMNQLSNILTFNYKEITNNEDK